MTLNKAMLIGRLGADPEVRYTQSGMPVANFNIATNEVWNDKSGQKQERTEWHKIVVFNKTAEIVGKYLKKGREVYIEGRIQTKDWQDKDGNKRYTTEIVANTVQFLGSQSDAGSGSSYGGKPEYSEADAGPPAEAAFDQSFNDDDIPF
ncbi:MAG: single-stranded DNA-binding protein [Bradymonadaceae bacterium]